MGSAGLPAREYGSGTTIRWAGLPRPSVFMFPPDGQAGQSYPKDGSPRDISMSGLLFEGGSRTDVFPRLAMTGDDYPGHTLWYCNLHNLGVRDMRTFLVGLRHRRFADRDFSCPGDVRHPAVHRRQ